MSEPSEKQLNTRRASFLRDKVYKGFATRNLLAAARIIAFVWFVIWLAFTVTARPSFLVPAPAPPRIECLEAIQAALKEGEDPDGSVSAGLPFAYAINGAGDNMLSALRDSKSKQQKPLALTLAQLCLLAYGCGNSISALRALGEILGLQLPISEGTILEELNQVDWQQTDHLDWYAVEAPSGL
jgi:hypothetical protein